MILTATTVTDFDQFMKTFATAGVDKRAHHGCQGAWVFRDPDDPHRVWCLFDWEPGDYDTFLADPEIPAIAARLGVQQPVTKTDSIAEFDH